MNFWNWLQIGSDIGIIATLLFSRRAARMAREIARMGQQPPAPPPVAGPVPRYAHLPRRDPPTQQLVRTIGTATATAFLAATVRKPLVKPPLPSEPYELARARFIATGHQEDLEEMLRHIR